MGEHKGAVTGLDKDIIKKVAYYFGDFNLPRDKFLQEKLKENSEGWIDIDTMLKFQRLSKLSSDGDFILKTLSTSNEDLIEVNLEGKKIRRNPNVPLPEKEDDEAKKIKTVYCKGFEKENSSLDDLLTSFNQYENVIHVNRRTWQDRKDSTRHFKGSVFVTFKDKVSAEAFMALESVKNPEGEELIRKWQADYFDEKQKEFEEKKAKKSSEKKAKAKMVEEQAKLEEEEAHNLPKGAVLFMNGFTPDTMREDIKKILNEKFDVANDAIAFVDFEKGQTSGYVRFTEAEAAKTLADKMNEKLSGDEKLQVKEKDIDFRVLEDEEEDTYLDKAHADMKLRKEKNKGHKRRHGGGGGRGGGRGGFRGGKRARHN